MLKELAKIPLPADRIFSQAESGRPKTEVLTLLQDRHPGTQYHFVEDKYGTLEKVCCIFPMTAQPMQWPPSNVHRTCERNAAMV